MGWNRPRGIKEEEFFNAIQIWIPVIQRCFITRAIEIGSDEDS